MDKIQNNVRSFILLSWVPRRAFIALLWISGAAVILGAVVQLDRQF